jgi:hypothetical protein
MIDFNALFADDKANCESVAPWPDHETGQPVICQAELGHPSRYHGSNGWSWEDDAPLAGEEAMQHQYWTEVDKGQDG